MTCSTLAPMRVTFVSACLFVAGAALLPPSEAEACGCFAPPDPSVPIVQAGERIVFSHEDGVVTAHIQIQYAGDAREFGWLLPLPAIPQKGLQLGVEELFTQVINTTQPKYRVDFFTPDTCDFSFGNRGGVNADAAQNPAPPSEPGLVVMEDSIGPFDYAVLDASAADEMFKWLTDNGYFIPTGTEDVVGPYIHDGAYFLALKLRSGESAGDIQPVVVEYEADYAMIPIVLTSVAANPDMGIQVWVLGEHRAIPRNYRHTILNDERIDWFNAGANYNDVVIAAANEAPDGQTFVTEYAGSTERMRDLLDRPGRFGDRAAFEAITNPRRYAQELRQQGFPYGPALRSILARHFSLPEELRSQGVTEEQFYDQLDFFLASYEEDHPESFAEITFDPLALTEELWERVVTPTLEAGALFSKYPKMTRLYTTLSPDEMTRDPVFSFNATLPDIDNEHVANFTFLCDAVQSGPNNTPGILTLPDGRRFYLESVAMWSEKLATTSTPYSRRIELLREEGPPVVEVDNTAQLSTSDTTDKGGCACSATEDRSRGAFGLLALGVIALVLRRRHAR